jgi:hypothetical protein
VLAFAIGAAVYAGIMYFILGSSGAFAAAIEALQ